MKIKLNKHQEEFIQLFGKVINGKYVYFPNVYKKLDNYEYEEMNIEELPEGIKKYIEEQKINKNK